MRALWSRGCLGAAVEHLAHAVEVRQQGWLAQLLQRRQIHHPGQEQIIQLRIGMGSQRPLNGLDGLDSRLGQAEAEVWPER